jgi:predicted outer membrane repeat protein
VATVDNFTDAAGSADTPGTLRHALTNVEDGDIITFSGVTPGTTTIALESTLPYITKSLTIEGNGVTLTRAGSYSSGSMLYIGGPTVEAVVRRVHFKDGLTTAGGAIGSVGILTVESCIFSGNRANNAAGALHGTSEYNPAAPTTLTIRGCTFYGNTAANNAGAVNFYGPGKTMVLEGNLFYGNTASWAPVVYNSGGTVSASYNVVDTSPGWTAGTGDLTTDALLVSPVSFKPLYNGQAANRLPSSLPQDYPLTDFYGNSVSGGGAAGAVQTGTTQGNYFIELTVNNSERGSVTVTSPVPDADGLYPAGSINFTVTPESGYALGYWLVDGVKAPAAPASLAAHTRVRAVFTRTLTVDNFTDTAGSATTPGTLRHALTNASEGDTIIFSGVTPGTTKIELESALPAITKSLTIEGGGITLTRATSWTTNGFLLRNASNTTEAVVRRIHFKSGLTTGTGRAIVNTGILALESCIFSDNRSAEYGGALYSTNTLTIRGCTFYKNTAEGIIDEDIFGGGAVFFTASGKTLTLTGNLFYGNTAPNYPVVHNYDYYNDSTVVASYNVADAAYGTETAQAGWAAGTGDTTFAALGVSNDPFNGTTFAVTGLSNVLPSAPPGFPTTDFYGTTRAFPGTPGAVVP